MALVLKGFVKVVVTKLTDFKLPVRTTLAARQLQQHPCPHRHIKLERVHLSLGTRTLMMGLSPKHLTVFDAVFSTPDIQIIPSTNAHKE